MKSRLARPAAFSVAVVMAALAAAVPLQAASPPGPRAVALGAGARGAIGNARPHAR